MDIFDKLINDFQSSSAWLEFSVLIACLLLAYGAMRGLHARYGHLNDGKPSVWIGRHALDGALFPLLALVLVFTSQEILARFSTVFWLRVAVSLLVSLSVIRFVARVLSRTFPHSTVVRLIERALRIGDNVRVDGFEGRITDIRTRYTIIRALNGRESIVPNETLITQRVENLTGFDVKFGLSTNIVVGMDSDVEQVRGILLDAAAAQPRVLKTPAPSVALVDFVEQGLQFSLSYYINDPQNGQGNVRSEVNLAVLRGLRAAGVSLPVPKQVVQITERGGVVAQAAEKSS